MVLFNTLKGQVPQGIPYQAVARNSQGQPLANLPVKVRFSVLDSTASGPVVYSETHTPSTSVQGLFSVNVGMGNTTTGSFSSINWGVNAKFLKVELDTTASGSNYIDLGTQQMMSVPYAFHAGSANRLSSTAGLNNGCASCPTMFSSVSQATMSAQTASSYCSVLVESGYTDWRLPSLDEFEYLRDVLDIPVPAFDCWTKDFTIVGDVTYITLANPIYVSTNRATMIGGALKTICIR